ncbi:hypothetical protein ACUXV3_12660 [Roseobacteraceae bacterium NS-SX3]
MTEDARQRLRKNIVAWKASGERDKADAAIKVEQALNRAEAPFAQMTYEALDQSVREQRLKASFARRPATDTEAKVIGILLRHPHETSSQLSRRLGWEAQTWHAHFGKACHAREDLLWAAPESSSRDERFYSAILADFDNSSKTWKIKACLASALAEIFSVTLGKGEAANDRRT